MAISRIYGKGGTCLFLVTLLLNAFSAGAAMFSWPDPRQHPRVLLNTDQEILPYFEAHPEWFKDDFLIGSFYITGAAYGKTGEAEQAYQAMHEKMLFTKIVLGDYISGTTAMSEELTTKYPPDTVATQDMSVKVRYTGDWPRDPNQKMVDLSDSLSESQLTKAIIDRWRHVSTHLRYIDNAAVHPGVMQLQHWDRYCFHMGELRQAAAALHAMVIFAVYARPWQLSDTDLVQLVVAVGFNNAVAMPLPWDKSYKQNLFLNGLTILRYRQMLDSGLVVILIPSAEASEDDLFAWLSTWRKPTDRIFMASPYWIPPPEPLERKPEGR